MTDECRQLIDQAERAAGLSCDARRRLILRLVEELENSPRGEETAVADACGGPPSADTAPGDDPHGFRLVVRCGCGKHECP